MMPNLIIFYIIILAGFIGTPVGNRNIAIVFIWILWWFVLIGILVPFGSRVWCTMCPMPFFGDWFQRRALIKVREGKAAGGIKNKMFGQHKKWPKALSNIWMQNIGFLALCTFSAILVTRPLVTSTVLAGITLFATVLAMIYRQRTFCTYLCPVSGFLSLYSMTSTVELRSADLDVCQKCKTKSCRTGNEDGWACPWFLYMGKLDRNNYCGFCMECVKSCPNDNIALNLRPFAADMNIKGYDEAWKGFIMLALAMAYSVILLGPNGQVKDWANVAEVGNWSGFGIYTVILWLSALVVLPAIFYAFTWIARRLVGQVEVPMKSVFLGYSYMLVPLGLLAWIAFSVPLIFVNGSYIAVVASDPFGWGWDLFGTAHVPWSPIWPEYLVIVQTALLLYGLFIAMKKTHVVGVGLFGNNAAAFRGLLPMGLFGVLVTFAFMKFFVG
jgi:ferredoxin